MHLKPQVLHHKKIKQANKGTLQSVRQQACLCGKNMLQWGFVSLKITLYAKKNVPISVSCTSNNQMCSLASRALKC